MTKPFGEGPEQRELLRQWAEDHGGTCDFDENGHAHIKGCTVLAGCPKHDAAFCVECIRAGVRW